MHLRENHVIAEIIGKDGKSLPRGEYGELVITTIGMEAMPLFRYRTGDYTRILPEKCPCGSVVTRIGSVSRKETARMAETDNILFSLPGLIDYSLSADGKLFALTDGSVSEKEVASLLSFEADIHCRRARASDKPLYIGKRTLTR